MNRRMIICVIINGLYRGGAQKILFDLIRNSDHSRFQFHVIYLNPIKAELVAESYLHSIQDTGAKVTEVSGNHLGVLLRLITLLRREKPDLIQTFLPLSSILGRISGVLTRIPVVSLQCNLPYIYPFVIRIADLVTLPFCTAWLGASRGIEEAYGKGNSESFTDNLWTEGRRHFTVYAGVDVTEIEASVRPTDRESVHREFSIRDDIKIVVMVARLVPWKGHRTLLRAMTLVPDTHVILVGWGPAEADLRNITSELSLENRVHFVGRRSDVYRILGAADVFVQTHEIDESGRVWQGPNLAQMEACAAGVPSISSAVPHIEELIEDGVTGRLVGLNNSNSLAEILNEMLADKEYSLQLSKTAIERVKTNFSTEAMIKAYERIWSYIVV